MNFNSADMVFCIWGLVGLVYIIYVFTFIGLVSKKHVKDIYDTFSIFFLSFDFLGKSVAKGLIYFIEAVIIGVLLNMLNGVNGSLKDSDVREITQTTMQCIFPIISLTYLAEMLDMLKEKFSRRTINNDQYSFCEKYGFLLLPSTICIFMFILSLIVFDDESLRKFGDEITRGIGKMPNVILLINIIISLITMVACGYIAWTVSNNNRPNVIVAVKRFEVNGISSRFLLIQNLGKRAVDIEDISANLKVPDSTDLNVTDIDLSILKGTTLVPGQSDIFPLKDDYEGGLNISVKYSEHNKKKEIQESFTFNLDKKTK